MIRRRVFLASLLAIVAMAAGCIHRGSSIEEDDSDLVTINVINHHRLNVTIFNVAQGHRDRIGEVVAAANGTFKLHLRRFTAGEIQLFADAIGSPDTVRSEALRLSPGDVVDWTLETGLNRSHVLVR